MTELLNDPRILDVSLDVKWNYCLTLLVKFTADNILNDFFFFFFFFFLQKTDSYISCKLSPTETLYKRCQILFHGKNKKHIIFSPSAEIVPRVVKVKKPPSPKIGRVRKHVYLCLAKGTILRNLTGYVELYQNLLWIQRLIINLSGGSNPCLDFAHKHLYKTFESPAAKRMGDYRNSLLLSVRLSFRNTFLSAPYLLNPLKDIH